ncbi:MAG: metallophosphoesterase family protein [Candidatus Aenigmarchaeota archaeon]|nr:metallophosphoesterase family protein [Candidatus Aenigmarchaeota archaeon]
MKKEDIIKYFLDAGFLVSPGALNFLANKDDVETIINKIKKETRSEKVVLGLEDVRVYEEEKKERKENIIIIKNLRSKPDEIKTEDFLHFYQDKYKKMQKIIQERINANFVSINKLGGVRKEVSLIGIIKDKKRKDEKIILELEDMTGTVPVIFNSGLVNIEELELDDVIAVRGISATKVIYGKEVMYPDIPLRSATRGVGKGCFISDLHLDEAPTSDLKRFFDWFSQSDIKYLFIAGDITDMKMLENFVDDFNGRKTIFLIPGNMDDKEYPALPLKTEKKNIISLSNPSMVELNGIKILLIHDFDINMLKKRYLGKSRDILEEDYLVLDVVPDIVHCGHTHEPIVKNYKSVTIVNSGSPLSEFKPVVIDFSTRAVEQVKL